MLSTGYLGQVAHFGHADLVIYARISYLRLGWDQSQGVWGEWVWVVYLEDVISTSVESSPGAGRPTNWAAWCSVLTVDLVPLIIHWVPPCCCVLELANHTRLGTTSRSSSNTTSEPSQSEPCPWIYNTARVGFNLSVLYLPPYVLQATCPSGDQAAWKQTQVLIVFVTVIVTLSPAPWWGHRIGIGPRARGGSPGWARGRASGEGPRGAPSTGPPLPCPGLIYKLHNVSVSVASPAFSLAADCSGSSRQARL